MAEMAQLLTEAKFWNPQVDINDPDSEQTQ